MNLRTTLVLALLLAIGITAVVLIDKKEKQETVEKETGEKLLAVAEDDIDEIALQPSGVRMVRYGDGWRVTEPVETPADMNNVKTLISMFGWAKKERTIEAGTAELAAYGLDPAYGSLVIHHHGVRDTILIGDRNVSNSLVYTQISGQPDIYLSTLSLRTNLDRTLFEWRDKNLFLIQSTDVKQFVLENSHGRFAFRRSGSDWLMQEPLQVLAERTRVGQIVSRLSTEKARAFVDENPASFRPYGLDKPWIRLELSLHTGQEPLILAIGKRDEARYYARTGDRPQVFLVDSSFVRLMNPDLNTLRDKKLAFFNDAEVDRIELDHSGQTLICAKDSSGNWSLIEPEPRQGKGWVIRDLLKSVTDLTVEEFVAEKPSLLKTYGLDKPRARAVFYIQDYPVYELLLGNTRQDLIYAKRGDESRVVLLKNDILAKLTPNLDDIALAPAESREETQ